MHMARYNAVANNKTTNISGHEAYALDYKVKLATMALTTMLGEPKSYGDNTDELIKIAEQVSEHDGEFVAKLAVWARCEGNMRSVSHALLSAVSHVNHGTTYVRKAVRRVASTRGDDGIETLATYKALYGKPWPHAVIRGVGDALHEMSPKAVGKYRLENRELKLRDALRICHPSPKGQRQSDAFKALVDGELKATTGWRTEVQGGHNDAETWDQLLAKGQLGYMATLVNLRNIIKAGANVDAALDMIANPDEVRRSRQLPFRFWTAYKTLANEGLATTKVTRALDSALIASCDNVPRLPGRTAVLIDVSGSMSSRVSRNNDARCVEVASLLGAMFTHISDDAWVAVFSNGAQAVPITGTSIISDVGMIPFLWGGTDMLAGFELLCNSKFDADRVVVLSDNEVNGTSWYGRSGTVAVQKGLSDYRRKVGHDVWCHAIDLQGYGTAQFAGPKVNIMAGWSDKVLDFVSKVENGSSFVKEIEAVKL